MMNADSLAKTCRRVGLGTLLAAPFAFGGVSPFFWPVLAWLWIALGATATAAEPREHCTREAIGRIFPAPLAALYALFAIQLAPLPASIVRIVSSGSFAAHFLPGSADRTWAPLTASPIGTGQALLFIAGLHGLTVALFARKEKTEETLRVLFLGMAGVGAVMALEGLIQAQSEHPYWLYGTWQVVGAGPLEQGIFGPYYNRDHFSNLIAIAASVTAGLLAQGVAGSAFRSFSAFSGSAHFTRNVALMGGLIIMIVASAASGSRGGLVALAVGLLIAFGPAAVAKPRLAFFAAVVALVAFFATGVPAAFERMGDIDFEASRLLVWRDVLQIVTYFPMLGCGIGAFAPAYWPYQRVARFEYWPHVHNEYLQWVLEGGALGVLLALFVARKLWLEAPRLVTSIGTRPALAGSAAALTHAFVDASFRVPANAAWVWILCAALVLGAVKRPATGA